MYYQVFIARKFVLKLRYVLSSVHCKESCCKVAVYSVYYQVFIPRKVVLKLRYILSSVHCKESSFKVAVCIIKCSFQGKLL